jgi:hypothetical protein
VWVFALQTQEDPEQYDPLAIDQWTFLRHGTSRATGHSPDEREASFFDARGIVPVRYAELSGAVADARKRNDELARAPT